MPTDPLTPARPDLSAATIAGDLPRLFRGDAAVTDVPSLLLACRRRPADAARHLREGDLSRWCRANGEDRVADLCDAARARDKSLDACLAHFLEACDRLAEEVVSRAEPASAAPPLPLPVAKFAPREDDAASAPLIRPNTTPSDGPASPEPDPAWYRRSGNMTMFIVAGFLMFPPLLWAACVICLTGPVYTGRIRRDGRRGRWSDWNKGAAVLILLFQGFVLYKSLKPLLVRDDRASLADVRAEVRDGLERQLASRVEDLHLEESPGGGYAGHARIGPDVWDVRVRVIGRVVEWEAQPRPAAPPLSAPQNPVPPTGLNHDPKSKALLRWPGNPPPASPVRQLATDLFTAYRRGDMGRVADLTWKGTVADAGGRAALVAQLNDAKAEEQRREVTPLRFVVEEPGEAVAHEGHTFVALPTLEEARSPAGRFIAESFVLAVSDDGGKTWGFVRGAHLAEPGNREDFVPRIPPTMKFPPNKKPMRMKD